MRSVEYLDLSVPNSHSVSGKWTAVAPVTTCHCFGMEAVVTGGKIYITRGCSSETGKASRIIECFDPNDGPAGRWTVVGDTLEFIASAKKAVC